MWSQSARSGGIPLPSESPGWLRFGYCWPWLVLLTGMLVVLTGLGFPRVASSRIPPEIIGYAKLLFDNSWVFPLPVMKSGEWFEGYLGIYPPLQEDKPKVQIILTGSYGCSPQSSNFIYRKCNSLSCMILRTKDYLNNNNSPESRCRD